MQVVRMRGHPRKSCDKDGSMSEQLRFATRRALRSLLLLSLLSPGLPSIAEELPPDSGTPSADTEQELLLFYEEKDLFVATKKKTPLSKAPAIATVVTAKEIRNMGARDLSDVIRMIAGFGLSTTEFGNSMVETRGIRTQLSEKILVMIDGHPLNRNFTGSALYNIALDLPVVNIRQVEVVRGPGSALYGANAFVAVINVITKDADELNGIGAQGSYASFDTRKLNVTGGRVYENGLGISASVDYFRTDGERIRIERDALSGTPFTTAPGYASQRIEKTDLFLKASYGNWSFRGHYLHRDTKGQYIGMAYALIDDSVIIADNYWAEARYQRALTGRLAAAFTLYADYYQQKPTIEIMPEGFAGAFPDGMIGRPLLKDRSVGSELQLDYAVSENNSLIVGVLYERMRQFDVKQEANFDPRTFPPVPIDLGPVQDVSSFANWNQNVTREIWAAYVQDEWRAARDLRLTAGVRHDHYSDFGSTTNPRAGAVWSFLENADLKLLYGRAFRAPNFVELYNRNNPVNIGNPGLKPEKIRTYEAGLELRLARTYKVEMNYFSSKIDDLIVWDTSTSPALHVNAGKAEVDGVELALTGNHTPADYWKLTCTYQDPRDAATGSRLPFVPRQRAAGSLNVGITSRLNVHTDVLWTGSRPRSTGDARADMPSYTTVDLAVILKNFYKTFEIQGTVHNLFDEKFKDPDTSGAQQLAPDDFPREGRSAMIQVSCRF